MRGGRSGAIRFCTFRLRLFVQPGLPLSEIAERAGFKHTEYFSVVFKKHAGMPPSQCRAQHRV